MDPKHVSRAYRQVSEISAELSVYADRIIKKLHSESKIFREQIIGQIKWSDVEEGATFRTLVQELQQIMKGANHVIIINLWFS